MEVSNDPCLALPSRLMWRLPLPRCPDPLPASGKLVDHAIHCQHDKDHFWPGSRQIPNCLPPPSQSYYRLRSAYLTALTSVPLKSSRVLRSSFTLCFEHGPLMSLSNFASSSYSTALTDGCLCRSAARFNRTGYYFGVVGQAFALVLFLPKSHFLVPVIFGMVLKTFAQTMSDTAMRRVLAG